MKITIPVIVAAAAMLAVGCDQQKQQARNDDQSYGQMKQDVKKSAKDAKEEVDRQAKAQKEMLDAEAKSAQAKVDAEKARAKAVASDADAKVSQASRDIQDAAGTASAKVQSEAGAAASAASTDNKSVSTTTTTSTSAGSSDSRITEQVQAAMKARHTETGADKSQSIQVSTQNGVVTLKGNANSDAEKMEMENAAKSVSGVTSVDNQITVKSQ